MVGARNTTTFPNETEAGCKKKGNVPEEIRMARDEVYKMGSATAALGDCTTQRTQHFGAHFAPTQEV